MNASHPAPLALKRLRIAWTAAMVCGAVSPAAGQIDIQAIVLPPPLNNSAQAYTARPGEAAGAIDFGRSQWETATHPAVWRNGVAELLPIPDLHQGRVLDADGGDLAGFTRTAQGSAVVATMWLGPTRQPVELNPVGKPRAALYAAEGGQQVGFVGTSASVGLPVFRFGIRPLEILDFISISALPRDRPRATLWRGTPDSAVDLHPVGADASAAIDTDGERQAGVVQISGLTRPAVWDDTAASFVELPAPSDTEAAAVGVDGDLVVGYRRSSVRAYDTEPLAWRRGTVAPVVLHTEMGDGFALDVAGEVIVGEGRPLAQPWTRVALLWTDPLAEPLNLHSLLPGDMGFGWSSARSVLATPNGYIIAGLALRGMPHQENRFVPVTWIVTIPEPRAGMLFGVLAALPLVRRRRAWPGTTTRA